jgi:dynactin complex subunit
VTGIIRFVGLTQFASGYWVGMELSTSTGKNNGSVQGVVYFTCGHNHGLFVRPSQVVIDFDNDANSNLVNQQQPFQPAVNNYTNNNNSTNHEKLKAAAIKQKREDFTSLVKTKIYEQMTVLNQQLDIVEQMERLVFRL